MGRGWPREGPSRDLVFTWADGQAIHGFALLFVAAWNCLAIALLERRHQEWREFDKAGKQIRVDGTDYALETGPLIDAAFPDAAHEGLRLNVARWIEARQP